MYLPLILIELNELTNNENVSIKSALRWEVLLHTKKERHFK